VGPGRAHATAKGIQNKVKTRIKDPLVTGDIGSYCVECLRDTSFGTGRYVNRIPADATVYDEDGNEIGLRSGWLCPDCNYWECDRCNGKIYGDEDVTPSEVYGDDADEFADGAYHVHFDCLTTDERTALREGGYELPGKISRPVWQPKDPK